MADNVLDVEYARVGDFDEPMERDAPTPTENPQDAGSSARVQAENPKLEFIKVSSWGDGEPPARKWLVPEMIPEAEVALLYGDGGTGKSLLATQLAISVATGTGWLDTIPESGGVMLVTAEDKDDELHRRAACIARRRGLRLSEIDGLEVLSLVGRDAILAHASAQGGGITPTMLFQALYLAVKERKPKLLVLDTLSDIYDGDEIKRTLAKKFINLLARLCVDFGTTVLVLAHPSLDGIRSGTGTSGSTGWNAAVRCRLYFSRPPAKGKDKGKDEEEEDTDVRILATKKSNYGPTGRERVLRYVNGVFETQFQSSARTVANDAADEQTFMACLDEFDRTGRDVSPNRSKSYAPSIFAETATARGTSSKRLADAMDRLFRKGLIHTKEEGSPSKRVKRVARGPAPTTSEGSEA